MASRGRKPRAPQRQPRGGDERPRAYRAWLREAPALRLALAEARKRFGHLEDVSGFGLGRKVVESTGAYGATPRRTGGLSVTVYVHGKKPEDELRPEERIPKTLLVQVPGEDTATRVRLDVVAVDRPRREALRLEAGRAWPTAGVLTPGRCLACGRADVQPASGRFSETDVVELGTVGALVELAGPRRFAISAGHVFVTTCQGETEAPGGDRAVGVSGKDWSKVSRLAFYPNSLQLGRRLRDAMLFQVPDALAIRRSPEGFVGKLADVEDVRAAKDSDRAAGFVLVERKREGRRLPVKLPVKLDSGADGLEIDLICDRHRHIRPMRYGFVWKLRFTKERSMGGDSGAGVYIDSAVDGGPRLLGFHFMRDGEVSYAVDADTFLRSLVGDPARDFTLL
jgi:hypothetical protein